MFSSDEFAKGKFSPHGHTGYEDSPELVVAVIEGPFNVETAQANARARLAYFAANFPVVPYVTLTLCRNSLLASHEVLEAHRSGIQVFASQFPLPAAAAWVADGEVEGFDLMGPAWIRNFSEVGVPMRMFRDRALAEAWLRSVLEQARQVSKP